MITISKYFHESSTLPSDPAEFVPARWDRKTNHFKQFVDSSGCTLWLFNITMENGPFIDGLPIKNGDFPWLC
jgi:hypothetical protein